MAAFPDGERHLGRLILQVTSVRAFGNFRASHMLDYDASAGRVDDMLPDARQR